MNGRERNLSGSLAESICSVALGDLYGRFYFAPIFLGDKHEAIDYSVQLVGLNGEFMPDFFFVQVRSTISGYTKKERHLNVQVPIEEMDKLRQYKAPIYILGVDVLGKHCYLVSANEGCPDHLSSLPTTFPIDQANVEILWREVRDFWEASGKRLSGSQFSV
jgi:hypothetical protein